MSLPADIVGYHATLADDRRALCEQLAAAITNILPKAVGRAWLGEARTV